ncbi:MAG: signal peptidase I [Eubacteriales bacterium]|nr:signal peptidase I [Eubacteriales bacterium]
MIDILKKTIKAAGLMVCILGIIVLISAAVMLILHIRPAAVVSGSMEPAIHTGSMVFIDTEYRRKKVVPRDIIAFENNGDMVVHRVKEVRGDFFITKGDANRDPDPAPVSHDSFRGRVIMWIPGIGYVTSILSQPKLMAILIATFVSVMLIYSLLGKGDLDDVTEEDTDGAGDSAA